MMLRKRFVRILAEFMHDTYEKEAKKVGWKTQEVCKVPFDDLPEKNKRVMLNMAQEIIELIREVSFR